MYMRHMKNSNIQKKKRKKGETNLILLLAPFLSNEILFCSESELSVRNYCFSLYNEEQKRLACDVFDVFE